MKYVNLGRTGLKVSRLTLGMMSFGNSQSWQLEINEAKPIVDLALDYGINFFDTANVYSRGRSEEITGELLKDVRDDVVIATKVRFAMGSGKNNLGLNRTHMNHQMKKSLERLQTDYVDLYQIHRWDYSVDIEFVMRSLNRFIDQGFVSYIGASSMYAWELAKAQFTAEQYGLEKFVSIQNHYNAIYREEEREMIPFALDQQLAIIPWSPLARGFLSGKYTSNETLDSKRLKSDPYLKSRYFRPEDFNILSIIEEIAKEENISVAQTSLAWLLSRKGVTSPIIGVTKIKHLEEAVATLDITLNSDHIKRIDEAYIPKPIIGHSYNQQDTMVERNANLSTNR